MNVIDVENLAVSFAGSSVVRGVSFSVVQGDFVGIAGPNGAGKTTLVRALLGLAPSRAEKVEVFGHPPGSPELYRRIGYLPQRQARINPLLPATSEEVVFLGLVGGKQLLYRSGFNERQAVSESLESLDIGGLASKQVSQLSGGQYQRVMLARALVSRPDMLILDEPSTGLDPDARESLFQLLKQINAERGITVLLITHDTEYIGRYARTLLYMDRELLYYGPTHDFPHASIHVDF